MYRAKEDQPLGTLISDLVQDATTLIRQGLKLARAEVQETASRASRDLSLIVAGGLVAYAGFLALIAGVVLMIALLLPLWAAALVVGAAVAGIGYFMLRQGMDKLKHEDVVPRQTIETLGETFRGGANGRPSS